MRIASVHQKGRAGLALLGAHGDLRALFSGERNYPGSLDEILAGGFDALADAGRCLRDAPTIDGEGLAYLPLLARPGKMICLGLNYAEHSQESGFAVPKYPTIFARFASSLVGHASPIMRPKVSVELDYEGELVAIIGKRGRNIPPSDALQHVVGYSIFNDASIRDFQRQTPQRTLGKNFDGTGSFGPWLVTADELPAGAAGLKIETRLNGAVVQSATTDDLIFGVPAIIAMLSVAMTLEPGDVIATGTPSGIGGARTPPLWMKAGDVCEVEIERIGVLRNQIEDQ
jgi:2-keto-4-pentenoate hydratase/2-oxohepta-3-ene-1,7-dioic acid hydratase in catechol pathway